MNHDAPSMAVLTHDAACGGDTTRPGGRDTTLPMCSRRVAGEAGVVSAAQRPSWSMNGPSWFMN
jgi:hypothetical protein